MEKLSQDQLRAAEVPRGREIYRTGKELPEQGFLTRALANQRPFWQATGAGSKKSRGHAHCSVVSTSRASVEVHAYMIRGM